MTYRTEQVAQLTGATLRQLQWFDERGYVSPRKDGHKRQWSSADMLAVSLSNELHRRGFTFRLARIAMKRLMETERRKKEVRWLVCDLRGNVFQHYSTTEVLRSASKSGPCLVVDVAELREKLNGAKA